MDGDRCFFVVFIPLVIQMEKKYNVWEKEIMLDLVTDIIKSIGVAIAIFCVGMVGGLICGFIIWSVVFYLGNSGSTGAEYVGYWDPLIAFWFSLWYGSPVGGISFWIAYYTILRSINWNRILIVTFAGTVLGGCIGAFSNPYAALFIGIAGFWSACFVLLDLDESKRSEQKRTKKRGND